MAVYDIYATRNRVGAGIALKQRQNQRIFDIGLAHSPPDGRRLLEIGPGDGHIAELAQEACLPYAAVEGNEAVAEGLRARGFEVRSGYVPPLPSGLTGPFSTCYVLHVIEHMPGAEQAAGLIEQIRSQLCPGGVLVMACPDFERWGSRFYDCDYTHSYPTTRRRLRQLVADQGLELVHETVYCGSGFGRRWLPLSWAARLLYPAALDGLAGHLIPGDLLHRGVLTFLPNLLLVAKRPV